MDEMFRRLLGEPLDSDGKVPAWTPRIDVEETDKEILVKADLPGVDPKDVDVSVHDDTLFLKGEKKEEHEEKKKNYHRVERFEGSFYRAIPLPAGTDPDKVLASSAKGVVTVTIPKKPELLPRKITVSTN